jgi:uncharacterized protein YdeI (YjbR/CyaY-like superfamily)
MPKSKTNPTVDAFISKAEKWQPELEALRKILLDCGLTEELKWGKPCYAFEEQGNVAVIHAFKGYFALLFMRGGLLKDPKGILVKTGENAEAGRQIRFTDAREIAKMAPTIKAYIQQAIEVHKAGLQVATKKVSELQLPTELQNKFKKDAAFKKAFEALTPGRQRGYIFHFSGAKQPQTRESRIEKCLPQILKGKGFNE